MADGANETRSAWLGPPGPSGPADAARIGATVHVLSLSFVVAIAGFVAVAVFLPLPRAVLLIPLGAIAIFLCANALARGGRARLAAHVLVAGTWLSATWAVALTGSANSPALGAYLIVVLAAGFLVGKRAAVAAAAAASASVLVIAHLEAQQRLPEGVRQTPWITIATMLTLIAATAALLWEALARLGSAVARAEFSEARMRGLIDQASDAIIVLDSQGNVCEASARAAEMSGYSREEITRMRVAEFLAADEREDALALLRDMRPGAVVMTQRRLRRRDGSWLPVENSLAQLSDGRIQCIVRDVSERKRAEAMQDRLRVALDEAGEAIALFDADQRLLYANRAARNLFGRDGALNPGMHVDDIIVIPPQREFWDKARHALALGRDYSGRFEYRLPGGARGVQHVAIALVREGDEVAGFVTIARDITREVELEESMQLTRRLEAVGQLAGGLAHDFNNLLTVILGSAEAIRSRRESADIDEIIEAGQRAAALTTQLLSFSRNQAIRTTQLDLNRVVSDASPMLRRLVRENVSVELNLASEPLWVMADANQLTQVLVNLAINARDAMPDGGTLIVATGELALSRATRPERVHLPDGAYAVLSVRDTGEGMGEDVAEHAFEPFFTTRRPDNHTGLGLARVHEIVKQARGGIEVKSEPGKGTQMRVFLPRALAPAHALEPPVQAREGAQRAASRILVVEDEALLRGLVTRSLEARGHQVVSARNGKEALELALAAPPDLLVTDVVMPGLDGSRLTAQLRERHPALRVLFVSGYEPDVVGGAVMDGQTRFLAKPFAISKLVERVDELLAQRQQSSQSP